MGESGCETHGFGFGGYGAEGSNWSGVYRGNAFKSFGLGVGVVGVREMPWGGRMGSW
jgi:hypothetical protein